MNKIYKVVWNAARNCYVVGSEFISKTRRGEGYRSNVTTAGARTLLAVCAACGISFYSGGLAVAADNLQTEPTIVIEVQEQKNEAVQPELLYSQLAAASAGADALDITMPADVPAAAEDTSEAPAVDVTSQHSVHDENGYYVYNGTENDTYNSLTKDGLWVGGVDDNTGFHVDNTGHASANGLDVQNQKITNVNDIVMQVETYNTSGNVSGYKALSFKDAGIVPGTVSGDDNTDSVVIGRDSKSSKKHSVVVGDGARTLGMNATAIGTGASAEMDSSVAIGSGSQVGTPSAVNGTAVGAGSKVTAKNGTAVGQGAFAWGTDSTVLGASARVERNADGSVALGKDSYAKASDILDSDTKGVVSVGKSGNNGFTRRIINVADGINASDAATYGQVKDVDAKIDDLDFSNTHYLEEAENVTDALKTLDTEAHDLSGKFDDFSRSGIMAGGTRDSRNAGTNSIQLGNQARAAGQNSIAFGAGASVKGENTEESILTRDKNNGVAIGYSATAAGLNTTVLGATAKAQGNNATALGQGTLVTAANSVALGAGSRVTTDDIRDSDTNGVVSVGKNGGERRIINVADGVNDSDAATYGQVKAVQSDIDALDELAVTYTDSKKEAVNFNKAKLQNIGDIQLGNATSTFVGSGLVNGKVYDTEKGQWAENGAEDTHSMAVGSKSSVRGEYSIAVGPEATVNNGNSRVLEQSTAVGSKATVSSNFSTALGANTQATGDYSVAIGAQSRATVANATAIGAYAAAGENSVVVGGGKELAAPVVSRSNGTAMGTYVDIKSDNGTALGYGSQIGWNGKNSVALGADSVANEENVVSVGHTKGQPNGFGGTYGEDLNRRIINVADGTIAEDSHDAVTGGQLYTTNQNVADNADKLAAYEKSGIEAGAISGKTTSQNLAIGQNSKIAADGNVTHNVAIGNGATVEAGLDYTDPLKPQRADNVTYATAVGAEAKATGNGSTVYGAGSSTSSDYSTAIGRSANAGQGAGDKATALGYNAQATDGDTLAAGANSKAWAAGSVALGADTTVNYGADNSVALGTGSKVSISDIKDSDVNGVVSVGSDGGERRIINVADGVNATDAATVGQMSSLLFGPSASFKESKTALAAGKLLTNKGTSLVDGINKNTAAINSIDKQLDEVSNVWETNSQSLNDLTEKASAFAAQTQNVDWKALNSVDWNAVNAMAAVPATMNLAIDDAQANEGDTGAEKDDDNRIPQTNGSNPGKVDGNLHVSGNTTLDGTLNVKGDATFEGNATFDKGATMKGDLNMSGNKITGLGAGDVSADSTDAVNGSQLFDVQQQVSDNRNAIGALGSRVSDLGEEVDSVGAISAALAGLHPLDYNGTGSKFQISAALGTYDGTQAAAIGGFYHFNRDTLLSIGGSTSFEGDRKTAANVGVTFRVGEGASEAPAVQDNETKQQMEAMKQEIEMLKAELEQLKNKDTEGTNDKN